VFFFASLRLCGEDLEQAREKKMKVGLLVTCLVDLMRPNIGFSSDVTREAHESALKPRSAWLCAGAS
jgi:hypothetical protein